MGDLRHLMGHVTWEGLCSPSPIMYSDTRTEVTDILEYIPFPLCGKVADFVNAMVMLPH